MRQVPSLSEIALEPQGGLEGVLLVPTEETQAMAVEFIARNGGKVTAAAMAMYYQFGMTPFAAHKSLVRWRKGTCRMNPDTYDKLWTIL